MEVHITIPAHARLVMQRLENAGYEAYVVGGCVRNALLAIPPNDWDMTTVARPEEMQVCFSDLHVIETGLKHGTLTVMVDGEPIEVTTYRNDGEYADNRHPVSVTFSTEVKEDLARRDFTVNAMAYHPVRGLVDLFGGREDLEARVIRCVGDPATRFREDGLRILRALRFAAVLDFSIDPETSQAVHACAHLLDNIAAERIREEFCKLICGGGAVRILREYIDVIGHFLPELLACVGFEQNTKYHCFDVFEHTLAALSFCRGGLLEHLAVLFHDIGKPLCYTEDENGGHFKGHAVESVRMVREITQRLRFDNKTGERLALLVDYHDREIPPTLPSVKRLMRKMSDEDISILMEVKRADRLAHAPLYSTPSPTLEQIPRLVAEIRATDACLSLASLAVKGDDLMAIGVPKGRRIGLLLGALLDDVIEERLPNEREALLREAAKRKDFM